jgi:NADH-quinone oxidoreductase subunit J
MMSTVLFYFLAGFILFSAYFVVTAHNLFRCALGLIAVLLGIAGLYLLMDAQFLSAVQVTVYVGGIVVLIVYVILLVADVTQTSYPAGARWRAGVAGAICALMFCSMSWAILSAPELGKVQPDRLRSATLPEIGHSLLSLTAGGFGLAFETISVLLVAVLIGAVTVARVRAGTGEKGAKGQ